MHHIVSPVAPEPPFAVTFDGDRGAFRRLVTRGGLLELVTLGFYRFWLTTDMRRHLWSHTSVGGDAPEYTGTAKELLIGFLVALAILMPIYIVYILVSIEAERWHAFASVPFIAFYYLFAQFALFRARRYRMTRTVWRGVRLWMTGSGLSYAWRSALWDGLVVVTVGLALPWRNAALERYKMQHTRYGDLQGDFVATGGQMFRRGWWLWLLTWPSVFLVVPLPFIYAVYKAIEWRWWLEGLRMGDLRVESRLDGADLLGLYWKVVGWSVLLMALLSGFVAAMIGLSVSMNGGETPEAELAAAMQSPIVMAAIVACYIAVALIFGIIVRLYLARDIWKRVVESARVVNLAAVADVKAEGDLASALGEGFADGLDLGGF